MEIGLLSDYLFGEFDRFLMTSDFRCSRY